MAPSGLDVGTAVGVIGSVITPTSAYYMHTGPVYVYDTTITSTSTPTGWYDITYDSPAIKQEVYLDIHRQEREDSTLANMMLSRHLAQNKPKKKKIRKRPMRRARDGL